MRELTLHYIFDPLCGWCYGAAPLVDAAKDIAGLKIALHGGGMMTGSNRRHIDAQWRRHVIEHDARIAALTGQIFGDAYINGLLLDTGAVMDSAPPTGAILAAESLAGRGLEMLHRIQIAHYQAGLRVADPAVLETLAKDMGLAPDAFTEEVRAVSGEPLNEHFAESRLLLERVRGRGFPTFALEDPEGQLKLLDAGRFLGNAAAWREMLIRRE
jgi:putative protein-disulfide isomerase